MHTSSSSVAAALVATVLLASSSTGVQALPTHRSTSSISRRAHLASHNPSHSHLVARGHKGTSTSTELGDHSIVVDASTASAQGNGGIKNSTINLTSISRRAPSSSQQGSTFSSFARVVRSLFSSSSSPAPSTSTLPLTTTTTRRKRSPSPQPPSHIKRLPLSQRSIALAGAKAPRSALKGATQSHESRIKRAEREPHQHARNVKQRRSQRVEPRAITYDAAAAQASAYSAAIANIASSDAVPHLEATASPVVNAALASPSANAAAYVGLGASLEELANASSSSASSLAFPAAATATSAPLLPADAIVMTVTQTVTLVPSGVDGAYVDAAGLVAPPAIPTSSAADDVEVDAEEEEERSSAAANPKASSSSASSSSSIAAEQPPLSTLVLPLTSTSTPSPSPSPSASTGAGMQRRVRRGISAERHKRARKVLVGGNRVDGSKVTWYHAPA
ncbi:hypothetical protein JCM11251_005939 [Rhodosporidiobolus azoricus]